MASLPPALPPVLLVHGIKDDSRKMARLAAHLEAAGRPCFAVDLEPNWGQAPLEELAAQVAGFVAATPALASPFDLLGFSMGGLVGRYYLQRLGGLARVRRFLTISTPHRGTWMAYILPFPGVRQMRPGSAFLRDLERDAACLRQVQFTSLWTPLDLIIVPAHSSVSPHGECRSIWCLAHPLMVSQASCLRVVAEALERP